MVADTPALDVAVYLISSGPGSSTVTTTGHSDIHSFPSVGLSTTSATRKLLPTASLLKRLPTKLLNRPTSNLNLMVRQRTRHLNRPTSSLKPMQLQLTRHLNRPTSSLKPMRINLTRL